MPPKSCVDALAAAAAAAFQKANFRSLWVAVELLNSFESESERFEDKTVQHLR